MASTVVSDEIKNMLILFAKDALGNTLFIESVVNITNHLNIQYVPNENLQLSINSTLEQYKTLHIDFVNIFFAELYKKYTKVTDVPTDIPALTIENETAGIQTYLDNMQAYFQDNINISEFTIEKKLYSDRDYTFTTYREAIRDFLAQNNPAKTTELFDKINEIPFATDAYIDYIYYKKLYNQCIYENVKTIYHDTNMLIAIYTNIYNRIRYTLDLTIYNIQLTKEHTPANPRELSKKIIKLMLDNNLPNLGDVLTHLQDNPDVQTAYFGKEFVSNITVTTMENILADETTPKPVKIIIPKLVHRDISQPALTKLIGLCNPDIYNLLQNADLVHVTFNKKEYYGLNNDLKFKTREHKTSEITIGENTITDANDVIHEIRDGSDDIRKNPAILFTQGGKQLLLATNQKFKFTKYTTNGYFVNYYRDSSQDNGNLSFFRNSICDIDFSQEEINTFKDNLENAIQQGKRYFFTYGSTIGFTQLDVTTKVHGGVKVSLIIDTQKKQIFFFKPMGLDTYAFYNINTGTLDNMIYYILPIYLMLHIDSLAGYTFIVDYNISPQHIEHYLPDTKIPDPNKLVLQANFSTIFSGKEPEFQEWSFGYCGLWNYLYIFLLVINPAMDICNIYDFLKALSAQKYKEHLIKLLLRNFAAHIEIALKSKYAIPTQSLKLDQLTANTTLGKLQVNSKESHNIPLRNLTTDNISKVSPGTKIINDTNNKHPIMQKKVPRNPLEIYRIIKGYSAYILAKGKHILYDPELIQFIDLDLPASR